ncbi:CD164 sialomucin-like 2 protein [Salmo salar]|uniref:CD164 sialomucin-like 2 protein n=1 Tax=Salmo salar TaxID=8030 RepID=A0A1S3M6J3_SALSA|nr:CD164 sialomucin-like 2 protein [Salmo salar]|eukprot:XP_013998586.1 PREDICTED: CD164 sialomucin-like 2 protein [Salmo salar]
MRRLELKALCAALLVFAVVSAASCQSDSSDCSQAESCDLCVGDSTLNLTGCVWRVCVNGNDTGCVSDQDDSQNCNVTSDPDMCTVIEIEAEGKGDSDGSPAEPSEFSQASFDLSSFIGGIILVLCVQAGGFFTMRFLKKDATYDPIEQPA